MSLTAYETRNSEISFFNNILLHCSTELNISKSNNENRRMPDFRQFAAEGYSRQVQQVLLAHAHSSKEKNMTVCLAFKCFLPHIS
jgi:hypothetical protein